MSNLIDQLGLRGIADGETVEEIDEGTFLLRFINFYPDKPEAGIRFLITKKDADSMSALECEQLRTELENTFKAHESGEDCSECECGCGIDGVGSPGCEC